MQMRILPFAVLAAGGVLLAEEPKSSTNSADTNPPVELVGPGVYRIGAVLMNREARTVSFPSQLNASAGPMEYLLVQERGKVHESILKTAAEPFHIQTAMLLLGVIVPTNSAARGPDGPIEEPSDEKLPGPKITIQAAWTAGGKLVNVPAERLVYNAQTKSALTNAAWVYNGSRMISGKFIGQIEGSIVSLITDSGALVNYEGPGHDNDQIWAASTNSLPPAGVEVQVTLKLRE